MKTVKEILEELGDISYPYFQDLKSKLKVAYENEINKLQFNIQDLFNENKIKNGNIEMYKNEIAEKDNEIKYLKNHITFLENTRSSEIILRDKLIEKLKQQQLFKENFIIECFENSHNEQRDSNNNFTLPIKPCEFCYVTLEENSKFDILSSKEQE